MMSEEIDWDRLANPQIISAKQMVGLIVLIEIIIQSFALMIAPTAWWTWQLLGFITATNLGAVMLAIIAQNTANDIGKTYKRAFTPAFYKTISLFSKFHGYFEEEAEKEGRDFDDEMNDLAPKLWGVIRAKIDVDAESEIEPLQADQFKDDNEKTDLGF